MDGSTLDMGAWLRRAEAFVRRLNRLPGRWGISVRVEPPLGRDAFDAEAREFSFPIPTLLRDLYTEGSASCEITYYWHPDTKALEEVEKVFPHQYSLGGGVGFIPWRELQRRLGAENWFWFFDEENPTPTQERARSLAERTMPLILVGNGDLVGVAISGEEDRDPVIYIQADNPEDSVTLLSESLEQFLVDWERLSYVGPEIWLLCRFLDEGGKGPLKVDENRAALWRKLLLQSD